MLPYDKRKILLCKRKMMEDFRWQAIEVNINIKAIRELLRFNGINQSFTK